MVLDQEGVAVGSGYRHLSIDERVTIEKMGGLGHTIRQIASHLGRSPSTISREIRRGLFSADALGTAWKPYRDPRLRTASTVNNPVYVGAWAHRRAGERQARSHKPYKMGHDRLVAYVCDKLRAGWSPQLICGRLKHVDHVGDRQMNPCPETLYAWIYAPSQAHRRLIGYLPRAHRRRRTRTGRKTQRSVPKGRIPISERPAEANDRSQFGHWEGDSIVGKNHGVSLRTEVERVSRLTMARHVNQLTADEALDAQLDMFTTLPPAARRSTTCDNGSEHAKHQDLKNKLGMVTYFAAPYHSWERGTNENRNGLIRRYFPKRTDFGSISVDELQGVVTEINNRPMALLGYYTPLEVFTAQLAALNT